MSLMLSCQTCRAPIARLDLARFPLAATSSYCRGCASYALIEATLAAA